MPFKERLRMIMHCMISLVIIFIAAYIYHYDSPTLVFGGIISWLYWKELKDSRRWKELKALQNSQTKK
jgi:hypothetical protein